MRYCNHDSFEDNRENPIILKSEMKTHKLKYLTIGHIEQIKKLWVPGKDTFSDKEAFTRSLDEEQLIELFYISGDWTYEEAEEEVRTSHDVAFNICRKQRLEMLYNLI
ncbi:MAG TPA: hypothetical protein DCG88_10925 [Sphingobacterium sp.]|nr:hypothetical protein [Sphingobacterium sp.]